MTKIITITGYKGGVGKSTTAIHLATFFGDLGQTLLVDGDPNRTAIKWVSRLKDEPASFTVADERQAMRMVSGVDYVIIDTPARTDTNDLEELAKGCDLLILPTAPDILSLEPMLETAHALKGAHYRTLITIVPPLPNKEGKQMQADLREMNVPVFDTMIRRTVGFAKAAFEGKSIRQLEDHRAKAAWEDYQALGNEVINIL